jgi:hypothetical protein
MKLTLPLRPVKPGESSQYPYGRPSQMAEAEYEPHEVELLRALAAVEPGDPGYEAAANSASVLHEVKVLLDARVVTPEEENQALLARVAATSRPVQPAAAPEPLQTTLLPPEGTETILKLPAKVREKLGYVPDFDGETIDQERDKPRLFPQLQRVGGAMKDGHWRTLQQVSVVTGDPEASVSARLRDLRKPKFGGHQVERRYVSDGLHEYKLTLNQQTTMPLGFGDPALADEEQTA